MAKMTLSVEVEKETYELGDALASIVESIAAKKEGGLTAAEIAAALTENVGKIMAGLDGAQQVAAEMGDDLGAFLNGVTIPVSRAVAAFAKKPAAPAPTPSA